jgi:signal transduction histidine kinase
MNLDEYQNPADLDAGNASVAESIVQPQTVPDAEAAYKLTENIPVGTYTIELNAAGEPFFSFCSSRWLTMLQLDRAAVMADPKIAFRCVHPDDVEGFFALNAFVMRNQAPFFWRGRIVVGGEIRWVVIESLPRERPGSGPIWEGVMIDITREVEMQEALERSAAEHQQHLRQKLRTSLTAAGIAHEINQPLSRLLLRAQLGATEPEKAVAALEAIVADAQEVIDVIAQVKQLLRSVQSDHQAFDLHELIASTLLQIQWQMDQCNVAVTVPDGSEPLLITGDPIQVQMALTNLLLNAIEAIRDADSPERQAIVSVAATTSEVRLTVSDTGPGWAGAAPRITAGELGELPLGSSKPGGSGLGLYMVHMIMENHAGSIALQTAGGGGAEVVLTFPRVT